MRNPSATLLKPLLLAKGFLVCGDILVLDNASIHRYRQASMLEDWLFTNYGILLIFLPARAPKLNPIELLWHTLVQRLKSCDLHGPRSTSHPAAFAAAAVMSKFTFEDVAKVFKKGGYL